MQAGTDVRNSQFCKCKALHLSQVNPQYQHRWENEEIESSPAEKDWDVLVGEKPDMIQ